MKLIKITCILFLLIFCRGVSSLAQKKNIDSNAYASWNSVEGTAISDNGKYVYYIIENYPVGHKTLVLQSTENNWKRSFKDVNNQCFLSTRKGDYVIFLDQKKCLITISLGKNKVQSTRGVISFSVFPNGESEWISYKLKGLNGELIFQNISTSKKYTKQGVVNSILGDDGQTAILQTEKKNSDQTIQELSCINLSTGKSKQIWRGLKAESIVLDLKHHQLAFIAENGLFSYQLNKNQLNYLINNQTTRLDSGLKLESINRFSNDGDRLFIGLKEEDKLKPKPGFVEVWSYFDTKLQPQQENEINARVYVALVNLIDGKIIRLEQQRESLSFNSMEKAVDTIGEIYNEGDNGIPKLISLKNGERTPLKYSLIGLSPQGKYVICLDPKQRIYFSYNTKTGIYQNISKTFSEILLESDLGRRRIAGWLKNDEAVIFYDAYDIWKLDLSGEKDPVNLTTGYGRKHHLIFSIIYGQDSMNKDQNIVLATFNLQSKKHGFYSLNLNKAREPKLLSMGDYYYGPQEGVKMDIDGTGGMSPIKAKKAEVYIVSRMSAKESTNYFSTTDFKMFKALSYVYPEREYKWFTTELHTWTSLDGKSLQGILYKPENFDPNKKYPVIFNYYESKSDNLNAYIKPDALCNGCVINIPTYLSNGYLVFTPDIVYKIGDPMQGTYDAVVSAAKYISALPFIDATKMGIQGCSWAGIQTNYLVTHTNLFAAACSASGIVDWVSNYGRLFPHGDPSRVMYEAGQFRMGSSLWEIPDAYIKNSPIFSLDKVTTPFLIMHTKKDAVCPYEDAIALFNGLRRLGKRSWMLVYPDANHGVWGKDGKDYGIRMMQFFDHYLKDQPAPVWMTHGIPAERRGLDDGLAYDTKIKTPGPSLLTPKEQKTVDSLMTRKSILIELK